MFLPGSEQLICLLASAGVCDVEPEDKVELLIVEPVESTLSRPGLGTEAASIIERPGDASPSSRGFSGT